jgi:thiamine biosynthesis protein ThiS
MRLTVNGEAMEQQPPLSLAELVRGLGAATDRVATVVNGDVVPRDRREARALADGDRIDILQFMGGG